MKYWTFERDGNVFDAQFDTRDEAQKWADDGFAEECEADGGWRNGDTASEEIFLLEFEYDDADETHELQRIKSTVNFEFYHGDVKEHGYP